MNQPAHNIICFEAEWLYNSSLKNNRFNLKTESLLNWLKEFHNCDVIYRHILHKADLKHYLDFFCKRKVYSDNYKIIYFACHGLDGLIHLEDEDIDLDQLADMAENFFSDKIVHFSSCRTLANKKIACEFKKKTGARLVSGYTKSVDAMKSSIADMALFNDLMYINNRFGIIKNEEHSSFWKTYNSLLNELGFKAY